MSFVCLSCKSQPLMPVIFPVADKVKVRADEGQDTIFAVEACWWQGFSGKLLVPVDFLRKVNWFGPRRAENVPPYSPWMEAVPLSSSSEGWRLLKKERVMKMKAKSHTRTGRRTSTLPPVLHWFCVRSPFV